MCAIPLGNSRDLNVQRDRGMDSTEAGSWGTEGKRRRLFRVLGGRRGGFGRAGERRTGAAWHGNLWCTAKSLSYGCLLLLHIARIAWRSVGRQHVEEATTPIVISPSAGKLRSFNPLLDVCHHPQPEQMPPLPPQLLSTAAHHPARPPAACGSRRLASLHLLFCCRLVGRRRLEEAAKFIIDIHAGIC